MQIKKVVYFDKEGERNKLNSLAEKHQTESSLAVAIEREFNLPFNDAMTAAAIWLKVVNKQKLYYMYIKTAGAYIALCDHYMILFRAVGEYPFFKIPSGMILNTYGEDGEIQIVKENSVEIQGILTHPERYAFACISSIAEGIRQQIDYTTTEKIQFDEEKIEIWLDRLALIDKPNSGLQINSLVMDIIRELNYSRPQALMMIQEMRKVLKNKKCIR